MRSLMSLQPMLRSVLALAVVSGFQACDGGGTFDPAGESTAEPQAQGAASQAAPEESFAALTTSSQRLAFTEFGPTVYKMDLQGSQRVALFTHLPGARSPAWSWCCAVSLSRSSAY